MKTRAGLILAAAALGSINLIAQINVTTNRYDQARTGANLAETTLTPANVRSNTFGLLYSYPVDGPVYAQPLYMSGVMINGAPHNVVYIATMNDVVYAFDADSSSPAPLWKTNFTNPPSVTAVPMNDILPTNTGNIIGNIGVQGTPVIDEAAKTIFMIARTEESGAFVQRLHALDITTGRERPGSPVVVSGSVPGTSADSTLVNGQRVITFNPKVHVQRAGLALVRGVVLIAWAAHEDTHPSHGWIMGYDSSTLAQVSKFAVVTSNYLGGIWQGGRAPAVQAVPDVDYDYVYYATGNGNWDGARDFGDSLLKFQVSRSGMTLLSYFTPGNEVDLKNNDDDLSGSGFTLLPNSNLLIGGGKEGVLYLLDGANLGGKVAGDTQIPQKIPVNGGHVMGGPVYWNSAVAGPLVYNWSEVDVLLAYRFVNGRLVTPPYAQGSVLSPGHPGGSLTVSANGSTAHTGIIWASMPTSQDVKHIIGAGTLRAFDAETLQQTWNSDQVSSRDKLGDLMKFVPPLVATGKVYVPNHDGLVRVYGLLPVAAPGTAAVGDAYVQGGPYAAMNFGTGKELRAKLSSSAEFTRISYVKFDIGSAGTVGRAVLRLTGHMSGITSTNVTSNVYAVSDTSWSETTLTWNNRPTLGSLVGSISVAGTAAQTLDLDVTSFVRTEQQAGHRFVAVALSNPAATQDYTIFNSRETGAGGPQLLITAAAAPTNADAYVQGGTTASTNFGASPELRVKLGGSLDTTRQSFLKFDLGAAPNVGRATLRVYGALSSANSTNVAANVSAVDDASWSESTITWNNKPAIGAVLGQITVPDVTPRWFEVDVTNYVRGLAAAGRRLASFALTAPTGTTAYITLNSMQASSNQPQLVIEAPVSTGSVDAYVRAGTYAATNFGNDPELLVKLSASASATRESYLKFDIPANATSAVLRLYGHLASTDEAKVTTDVYGVADTSWQESTINWNNRPAGGTLLGTVTVVGMTPAWVELDVTGYVRSEAAAGRSTVTFALRNLSATATWTSFNSGEAAANPPQLEIK